VKTFDSLFAELQLKALSRPEGSGTVTELDSGVHGIGKKVVEEAQLLYHVQVLMLARGLTLDDVYRYL